MKKVIIALSTVLLTQATFASNEFKCGKKYSAVSCSEVKNAKRTHLCLKHPKKLTEAKKVKWCKKVKKSMKKTKKVSKL